MLEDPLEEPPLEEPLLEEPLLEAAGVGELLVLLEEPLLLVPLLLDEFELSVELSPFLALPPLLYRSAYQPPPLRMKPAPPETWRLAVA